MPCWSDETMAAIEQKIYLIGGQKVISTAMPQYYRAVRRKSRFRLGGVAMLFRLLSRFKSKNRASQEALPASAPDENYRTGLTRPR